MKNKVEEGRKGKKEGMMEKRKISSNSRQSNSTGSKRERKSLPGCNDNVPRWVFILSSCLWEAASGFFFHSSLIVMFHYQGKVSQMLFHHKDEWRGGQNEKLRRAEIFQVAFGSNLCGADVNASLQGGALHVMH